MTLQNQHLHFPNAFSGCFFFLITQVYRWECEVGVNKLNIVDPVDKEFVQPFCPLFFSK